MTREENVKLKMYNARKWKGPPSSRKQSERTVHKTIQAEQWIPKNDTHEKAIRKRYHEITITQASAITREHQEESLRKTWSKITKKGDERSRRQATISRTKQSARIGEGLMAPLNSAVYFFDPQERQHTVTVPHQQAMNEPFKKCEPPSTT
jgi:hypothetical protein